MNVFDSSFYLSLHFDIQILIESNNFIFSNELLMFETFEKRVRNSSLLLKSVHWNKNE